MFEKTRDEARRFVRAEMDEAKREITARARRDGKGAALVGGGAVLLLLALAALTTAAVAALATELDLWLSALIVAAVYIIAGTALAIAGRRELKRGGPPLPTDTMRGFKDDVRRARANGKTTEPIRAPGPTRVT